MPTAKPQGTARAVRNTSLAKPPAREVSYEPILAERFRTRPARTFRRTGLFLSIAKVEGEAAQRLDP
jgi:hypothetical protein